MPKMKTKKSVSKKFKITKNKKVDRTEPLQLERERRRDQIEKEGPEAFQGRREECHQGPALPDKQVISINLNR